jgi:uncharacterized protein YcbK (DUF882 family)
MKILEPVEQPEVSDDEQHNSDLEDDDNTQPSKEIYMTKERARRSGRKFALLYMPWLPPDIWDRIANLDAMDTVDEDDPDEDASAQQVREKLREEDRVLRDYCRNEKVDSFCGIRSEEFNRSVSHPEVTLR